MEGIIYVLVMFLLFVVLFLFVDLAHEFLLNRARIKSFIKNNTDREIFEEVSHTKPMSAGQQETHELETQYDERKGA